MTALGLLLPLGRAFALAELRPEKVHTADTKKTETYIRDGLFIGGDKAIDEVWIKDIRRAANPRYERVVIDLEGNMRGEPAAIQRPPYFQVAVSPDEKRLTFTIWGKPKFSFDPKKILAAFKKSVAVQNVSLLPRLEDESWTFVLEMKGGYPIEVFELSNPVRIIVDVRTGLKK